jgi:E3 ubiquitin-protein ligase MYCBP2
MAPSVAQSIRAVFAAFLWHEGIVHDAMACASFLKFHPDLPKELPRDGSTRSTPTKKKKDVNINEAVGKLIKERALSESSDSSSAPSKSPGTRSPRTLSLERGEGLPLTMRYLVLFWEELSGVTLKVIQQNLIQPSPPSNAPDKKAEKEKGKALVVDKKPKKPKKEKYGARGNLFGESAALFFSGRGEKEALCELCGGLFPHPVTYHMKDAHPGCGHHAGGQGYNSGGNFCGGWAGNCGDGGIGGSTWYLMCVKCRQKYLEEKRQGSKEKSKKERKKSAAPRSHLPVLDSHVVIKNNAMFLLDLASSSSAAGLTIPRPVTHRHTVAFGNRLEGMLPSVQEDSNSPDGALPFSPTPFLYLRHHGAEAADSAFADDSVFCDSSPKGLSSSSNQFDSSTNEDIKMNINEEVEMLEPRGGRSLSAQVSPCDAELMPSDRPFFQRSISEISSGKPVPSEEESSPVVIRRRNNSGGLGDDGMSLLKHPSVAMARLIQSVSHSSLPRNAGVVDQALKRPVLSFVMQRHDLDSLQIAMRHSLRKAACRVFALQVRSLSSRISSAVFSIFLQAFNWLLRNVSLLTCIHDLLWHFVSSLTVSEERTENDPKKEQDQVSKTEHLLPPITLHHLSWCTGHCAM